MKLWQLLRNPSFWKSICLHMGEVKNIFSSCKFTMLVLLLWKNTTTNSLLQVCYRKIKLILRGNVKHYTKTNYFYFKNYVLYKKFLPTLNNNSKGTKDPLVFITQYQHLANFQMYCSPRTVLQRTVNLFSFLLIKLSYWCQWY